MLSTFLDIWKILTQKDKYVIYGFLILLIFQGGFELIGVISVVPLFSVISNPQLIETNSNLNYLYNNFNFTNLSQFIIFLSVSALLLISFRILITFTSNFLIHRFIRLRNHQISLRLLKSYVAQPYNFFLEKHSSELGKNILSEVEDSVVGCLYPLITLFSQTNIFLFLVFGALAFAPSLIILSIGIILVFYSVIYFLLSDRTQDYGESKKELNSKRYKVIQEVFSGIKEVKLSGHENFYFKEYGKHSLKYAQILTRLGLLKEFPKYLLEFLSMMLILGAVVLVTSQGDDTLEKVLPTLSAIALGGIRILPAIQKIYQSVIYVKFSSPAVKALKKDLTELNYLKKNKDIYPTPIKKSLEFKNVIFKYSKNSSPALKNLSFEIHSNSIIGIVGSTGAGKSTIVDLLSGLLKPTSGQILLDKRPLRNNNIELWQKSLGYVPQQIFIADDTITNNIALGIKSEEIDFEKVKNAAKKAMIYDFITEELPSQFDTKLGERGVRISGGQRQRIGLARAFYSDPPIIILDEATSSLDTLTERRIIDSLKKISLNKTLIIIAHRLNTVRYCDKIFFLEKGTLKDEGTFDELLENNSFKKFTGM